MKADDKENIAPSMCYAYAALAEGCPFIMGAPNTTVDIPAREPSGQTEHAGADDGCKAGFNQSLAGLEVLAGDGHAGLLREFPHGGNVHRGVGSAHYEGTSFSTLESILVPEEQPDLYSNYYHKVRINYYPPRNDNKEGWDNIDIFGWMGYPMQIKINLSLPTNVSNGLGYWSAQGAVILSLPPESGY